MSYADKRDELAWRRARYAQLRDERRAYQRAQYLRHAAKRKAARRARYAAQRNGSVRAYAQRGTGGTRKVRDLTGELCRLCGRDFAYQPCLAVLRARIYGGPLRALDSRDILSSERGNR